MGNSTAMKRSFRKVDAAIAEEKRLAEERVYFRFSAISAISLCDPSGEKLLTAECAKDAQGSQGSPSGHRICANLNRHRHSLKASNIDPEKAFPHLTESVILLQRMGDRDAITPRSG